MTEPEFSDTEEFRDGYFDGFKFHSQITSFQSIYRCNTNSEYRKGFVRGYFDRYGVNLSVDKVQNSLDNGPESLV